MPHKPHPPFYCSEGPRTAAIALVGEAFGEQEDLILRPFQGYSGQELSRMLEASGIDREACFLTNTFNLRPENNKIDTLFAKKADAGRGALRDPAGTGKYIQEQYLGELDLLRAELEIVQPNVVIALGNTAVWALAGTAKISQVRGVFAHSTLVPGLKILPTYHPAGVLRNWAWRPIVLADLMKAKAWSHTKEITRPERWVLLEPNLDEIAEWFARPARAYSVDIETSRRQITCLGFSRNRQDAIVIPFLDERKPGWSYWPDLASELAAWEHVGKALASPTPKIFQNGLYDLQYIWSEMTLQVNNCHDDTMLLHHALFPEMPKSLGFLGSIYTNEASWKLMRHLETTKRDE